MSSLRPPRRLRSLGHPADWLRRPEFVVIVLLLLVGAILRPVVALSPGPIAVAPTYARSAMTLYEVLREPDYLVPVTRRTPEAEVSAENAVVQLLQGPLAGPDLVAPFALGTELLAFEQSDGRASLDLSAGALDGVDAQRAIEALVLTLTEFPEVTRVAVSVDGRSVAADGTAAPNANDLTRPTLNPESAEAQAGGMEVWFAYDGEDRYLVPVTRATAPHEREPTRAMDAFLAGPLAGSDLEPVLPHDVNVLSVRVRDGLATVDFDSHLVYAYRLSQANAMFVRRAVMATLTGLPDISAGLIEIDGSTLLLYTCVNVLQEFPQARPWAVNDEYYLTSLPDPEEALA